jgi:putative PIN family toxin of toxin-antitoxin system
MKPVSQPRRVGTGHCTIACDIIRRRFSLRLVLDTDVVVAALRSDQGASRRLLIGALDRAFEVLASVPLIIEYEAVLTRPEHLAASGLTSREMNEVLDALVKVSVPVHFWFLWRPRLKDPADEMVLETAVNGEADWLVTFNVRHLAAAAREFGIRVMRPCDAWWEIRKHEKK